MAIELVLDASVSLAWFLKETPERAAYAAAVSSAAANGLKRAQLQEALEDLESFDIRVHLEVVTARHIVELARRYQFQGNDGHRQAAGQHDVPRFAPD